MTLATLVNAIPGIETKTYLELGVAGRQTFDAVQAGTKVGVDLADGQGPGVYRMSTDDFFAPTGPGAAMTFDVAYIDACHEYEQVTRDYNNAVAHMADRFNGVIFLHDMVPPDETFTSPNLCGDVYRLLAWLICDYDEDHDVLVLDHDMGLTMVRGPKQVKPPANWAAIMTYPTFRQLPLPVVTLATMLREVARL